MPQLEIEGLTEEMIQKKLECLGIEKPKDGDPSMTPENIRKSILQGLKQPFPRINPSIQTH
jgi:hypothetical protein